MKEQRNAPTDENSARPSTDSIKRAGVKNIFISLFVAGASFYSLTLIATHFGGSVGSDAYFFLASLSTLASGIIGSLMGTVFLPAFIKLLTHSDKSEAHRFASSMFSWCLLISSAVALPTIVWNEQFFMLASRFDASQISQMHQVLKYFGPIFLFSVISELFRVIVLSIGKYSTAAFAALFPPFFLIIFIIFFGNTMKEEGLVASLLAAKVAALLMLGIVVSREGIRVRFFLTKNSNTFQFVKSSAPYWSANVITNTATFYFDYQASGFGAGVVSALAYANRMFMMPITLFLVPLVEISRTKFAQFQAADDNFSLNNFYNNLISFALYFSMPIAAIYLILSQEIISAMFQRGTFQSDSVIISASCLVIFAWSIPFNAVFIVNGRACESFQKLFWPSFFGTIGNLLMIGATFFLTETQGVLGIPMARVMIESIYMFPFGFIAYQLFGGKPKYVSLLKSFAESIVAALIASLIFKYLFPGEYNGTPILLNNLLFQIMGFIFSYMLIIIFISFRVRKELSRKANNFFG